MTELPAGTVSLLFSDIEGSTLLLSRLGARYAEALDGQRQVMRQAWEAHGGTELGTEGDSFFVVFRTAEAAITAAAQAQRDLDAYPWPGGERVRVRIGIHTGSPHPHDGSYVGMDVHRAARIAGSAHGGQVVVSSVTADLARGGLPDGVRLLELGTHQLKDIAAPEHLLQLTIDGLPTDFPPLKTLGAASSLPVPATLLIGRDGEVAELSALIRSPGVRLVTLTGPGGSGKTRLATAVAQRLVTIFPDGVYFVPLADVTSADVMWTSIAEVLDVPPNARTPPRFFNQVAHRSALFVLDNLEQLPGADDVVAQLLAAAPASAVIASSRRALSVPAEHRHPVPPLTLPEEATLTDAESAGAVQLFVDRARSVRPDFQLTIDNVADVAAICRRLDGLPLAIELSAARMRLLSPKALLARLDKALDIASIGSQGPGRQKTLRDTIAWSYQLLTDVHQAFVRRMGVFAGGADLNAVAEITADATGIGEGADALDMVADLADASLVTIHEGPDGEPRIVMLEMIRSYARDQLRTAGELDTIRSAHARHYLHVAGHLQSLRESRHLFARDLAEIELDNFREALSWTLRDSLDGSTASSERRIGPRLCSELGWFWLMAGYLVEGRRWHEQAIEQAGPSPSRELAVCLSGLANLLIAQGEFERARELADRGLAMARTLGDEEGVAFTLGVLGTAHQYLGDVEAARSTLHESLDLHRQRDDRSRMAKALGNLAGLEESLGHFERSEAMTRESLSIVQSLGDMHQAAVQQQNLANLFAITGRLDEANELATGLVETVLKLRDANLTVHFANTYMNILIRRGEPVPAAHLLGAEEAMRERDAMPNPLQEEELQEAWSMVRGLISIEDWNRHRRLGREKTVEELLAKLGSG